MIPSTSEFQLGEIQVGGKHPFVLIAGPCVAEDRDLLFRVCESMLKITTQLKIPYIFKTSFDKANRSSINGYRGPGMDKALGWLAELKEKLNIPILTDVHLPDQCATAAEVADVLQIPAFLCRQTDLIHAAAITGKVVNVKQGQFLSPWDTKNIVEKVHSCGNERCMITVRGTSFGYNNLIVDQRSFPVIRETVGVPVVFDATHSVQLPGGLGNSTDGQRQYIPNLARAAVANGVDALFMETHPTPNEGLSDPTTMYALGDMQDLLTTLKLIDNVVKDYSS